MVPLLRQKHTNWFKLVSLHTQTAPNWITAGRFKCREIRVSFVMTLTTLTDQPSVYPCVCVSHLLQRCHGVSAVGHAGTEAGRGRSFVVLVGLRHKFRDGDEFRHV